MNEMSDDDTDNDLVIDLTRAGDKALKARESKRRYDKYMKDCFTRLRYVLPALRSNMQATQLQILEEAADYISSMQAKNSALQQANDYMKSRNRILEDDKAKATGNCAAAILEATHISSSRTGAVSDFDVDSEDSSDNSNPSKDGPRKRLNPN